MTNPKAEELKNNIEGDNQIKPVAEDRTVSPEQAQARRDNLKRMEEEAAKRDAQESEEANKELSSDFGHLKIPEDTTSGSEQESNLSSIGKKEVSRRGFLKWVGAAAAGVMGASIAGENAGGAEKKEAEKNENKEANKLLKHLFELQDNPKYDLSNPKERAKNNLDKMKVAGGEITLFALRRKLGFPDERKSLRGYVSPEDEKGALKVLRTNLNAAVELNVRDKFPGMRAKDKTSSDEEIKQKIKDGIYSHPGISELQLRIDNAELSEEK